MGRRLFTSTSHDAILAQAQSGGTMRPASIALCALGVAIGSCVRAAAPSSGRANQSVITRDDIERIRAATALDIVQRYRADVLTERAPSSVYMNKHIHPVVFLNEQY